MYRRKGICPGGKTMGGYMSGLRKKTGGLTVIQEVQVDHSHLTITRNKKFLTPHLAIRLRMPQLYLHLHLQVASTSFMIFK